jgi:hypothetical protein
MKAVAIFGLVADSGGLATESGVVLHGGHFALTGAGVTDRSSAGILTAHDARAEIENGSGGERTVRVSEITEGPTDQAHMIWRPGNVSCRVAIAPVRTAGNVATESQNRRAAVDAKSYRDLGFRLSIRQASFCHIRHRRDRATV